MNHQEMAQVFICCQNCEILKNQVSLKEGDTGVSFLTTKSHMGLLLMTFVVWIFSHT